MNKINTFNVLYTFDKNYLSPSIVSSSSLLKNIQLDKNQKVRFFLSSNVCQQKYKTLFINALNSFDKKYELVCIDIQKESKSGIINKTNKNKESRHLNEFAMAWIYALKKIYEKFGNIKILVLDSDTYVNIDISEIFKKNYKKNILALESVNINFLNTLDPKLLFKIGKYYNSGVIYFSLNNKLHQKISEMITFENIDNYFLVYQDQCLFNLMCSKYIDELDEKYNYITLHQSKFIKKRCLYHFIGSDKPWFKFSLNPYSKFYKAFAKTNNIKISLTFKMIMLDVENNLRNYIKYILKLLKKMNNLIIY